MSNLDEQDKIDDLRSRLYSRGNAFEGQDRHGLTDRKVDVSRNWSVPETEDDLVLKEEPKKRTYRKYVLIGSLVILAVVMAVTGAFFYSGGNQISSSNIDINIAGPNSIGGGETVNLQIGVTNQNAVAIESATLILKYPSGTKTSEEPVQDLFEERIFIDTLQPGEARNIAVRAIIYGEEGDKKQIDATIEYRIAGSGSLFHKDSEPLKFEIVSSPIVLQIRSVRKVASGQEVDVIIVAKSNVGEVLKNVLITTSYPNGFRYLSAEPAPTYNQNVWKIDELKPEESTSITLRGVISGLTAENIRLSVSAGPARSDNQFIVGAILSETYTEFQVEKPFIDVQLDVGGDTDGTVILEAGKTADVNVMVRNTLDESVYDLVLEVVPGGNALGPNSIDSSNGFYDSNRGVVRFDVANNPSFSQVAPGDSRTLSFNVTPSSNVSASSFDVTVNVYARRIAEPSAQEKLVGTATVEARYSSAVSLEADVAHTAGAKPPKVGESSTYRVTLKAIAGANHITKGVVTASLPSYVNWLDQVSGGTVNFNPVSKELEWQVGDLNSGQSQELTFNVSLLPSGSQVGIKPILVNQQTIRATDRFTNVALESRSGVILTESQNVSSEDEGQGIVISN